MMWISYLSGVLSVALAYAIFSSHESDELELDEVDDGGITINEGSSRIKVLPCQTCRKLNRHREVRPHVFECNKCGRILDAS